MSSPSAPRIVFVAFEGVEALDITGPWEVLHTAGLIAGRQPELVCVSSDGRDVRSNSGLSFRADARARRARAGSIDTLVVPAESASATRCGSAPWPMRSRRSPPTPDAPPASAPARSCSPRRGCSTGAGRPPTGRAASAWPSAVSAGRGRARPDLRPRRRRLHLGRGHAGHRPGPGARRGGPRRRGRPADRPLARHLSPRRPGGQSQFCVQLAASARRAGTAARAPGLDRGAPGRGPLRRCARRAGPPVVSGSSPASSGARLGTTPADYVEQLRVERARGDARDRRRRARADRQRVRLRHGRDHAPRLPAPARQSARASTDERFRPPRGPA